MTRAPENPAPSDRTFFSRDVVGGVPWMVGSKLVLLFVYFGIPIALTRTLGEDHYGLYSLCRAISEVMIVFCGLGLNTALIRFIPELCVSRSRSGLFRLLARTAVLQAAACLAAAAALLALRPALDRWFTVEFGALLLFTGLLTASRVFRAYIDDAFTAFFRVRAISVLSVVQGVLWCAIVLAVLPGAPETSVALLAQALPLLLTSAIGLALLVRHVRRLDWSGPSPGVGKRRVGGIAAASLVNSVAGVIMRQYTEVFFLGVFFTPAVVGWYSLGCEIPLLLITFIPLALRQLFTSGFAEAYARDPACLGRLVDAFFKALIITVLPLAAFGAAVSVDGIPLVFGGHMREAGPIAALFFLVHTLSLLSVPLAMAIVTREKIFRMLPFSFFEIAVNLALDYILISRYGMYGAVGAVFGTFLLTLPLRLWLVARVVGGVYFPLAFFARITLAVAVPAAAVHAASRALADYTPALYPYPNLLAYAALGAAFTLVFLALVRVFRLIRREDTAELETLGFRRLNQALALIVR